MRKKIVTTATAVFLAASFTGQASAATHEVKSGDSLWKIASNYNTTVAQLKEMNNLKNDLIYPRQVLHVTPIESAKVQNSAPKQPAQPKQSQPVAAKTYVVKAGDSLYKIASLHKVTIAQLKQWNGLKSDLIHPGQVFKVSQSSSTSTETVSPKPAPSPAQQPATGTYKVVSGDTLGKIALKYGTTVSNLKSWNNLKSDLILVGQVLKVNGSSVVAPKPEAPVSVAKPDTPKVTVTSSAVIDVAKNALGTKYAWGGSSLSGFDCSGFIYYVFNNSGKQISRLSADGYFNRSYYVNKPEPGDLVFFENTYKRGISHMGIFLGNGQFIHAGDNGVEISSLSNSYWKSKFNGYKKFY
ncbi:LysM peptidoglycan-binding domain-containing protein [Lederbergia citrea]|uniref:C40 family peptidase n=1 Tax=Lederbergia citrea TaxID=2833581 RepID=UPI001BC99351|nr:peptidoglycan endopeptidase [Lederbergia citrea]MBS4204752.1 LysM peptidoglycan-binding domain-containing protein [Lederbergia citrea]